MRLVLVSILALFIASDAYSQTSTIQTVAGGALPENTPGTSASLGAVNALAVDGAGNVFLGLPSVVLRLDAKTGILTRLAGNWTEGYSGDNGPATGAQLPRSLKRSYLDSSRM